MNFINGSFRIESRRNRETGLCWPQSRSVLRRFHFYELSLRTGKPISWIDSISCSSSSNYLFIPPVVFGNGLNRVFIRNRLGISSLMVDWFIWRESGRGGGGEGKKGRNERELLKCPAEIDEMNLMTLEFVCFSGYRIALRRTAAPRSSWRWPTSSCRWAPLRKSSSWNRSRLKRTAVKEESAPDRSLTFLKECPGTRLKNYRSVQNCSCDGCQFQWKLNVVLLVQATEDVGNDVNVIYYCRTLTWVERATMSSSSAPLPKESFREISNITPWFTGHWHSTASFQWWLLVKTLQITIVWELDSIILA